MHEFINKNIKSREEEITQSDEKILVLNGVSYGSDIKGFIDKLKPKKYNFTYTVVAISDLFKGSVYDKNGLFSLVFMFCCLCGSGVSPNS